MIYLIGGPPRCGKTTLAERLSEHLHIPWIPTDYLESVVNQYIPESEVHPLTRMRQTTHKNNDVFYREYSADQIITFYRDKAKTTWPGLKAFIEYAAHEQRSFILEGLHIDPAYLSDVPTATTHSIRSLFLHRTNHKEIEDGFRKSKEKHDWVIEHTNNRETFSAIATMISEYGVQIREEAKERNLPACCMDGNFETQMQKALDTLLRR